MKDNLMGERIRALEIEMQNITGEVEKTNSKVDNLSTKVDERVDTVTRNQARNHSEIMFSIKKLSDNLDKMDGKVENIEKAANILTTAVNDHIEPSNHSKMVVNGIIRALWGEKTIRKIIIGVFLAGILALLGLSLPYQQILERLNTIWGVLGKM